MSKASKAILIPFDTSKPVEVIDLQPGLDAIYERVAPDSRMFEVVRGNTFDLYGDEEGGPLMRGDADERINVRAMELFAKDWNTGPEAFARPLCGDFLVVGKMSYPSEDEEVLGDAPEWVIGHEFQWRLEMR